jgi:hypothetical protein
MRPRVRDPAHLRAGVPRPPLTQRVERGAHRGHKALALRPALGGDNDLRRVAVVSAVEHQRGDREACVVLQHRL